MKKTGPRAGQGVCSCLREDMAAEGRERWAEWSGSWSQSQRTLCSPPQDGKQVNTELVPRYSTARRVRRKKCQDLQRCIILVASLNHPISTEGHRQQWRCLHNEAQKFASRDIPWIFLYEARTVHHLTALSKCHHCPYSIFTPLEVSLNISWYIALAK